MGCPYVAVGMQRALDSAIGLPSRSTSASWMLVFLMPAEVRRSRQAPPGVAGRCRLCGLDLATHNPRVLADLASPHEPVLLEQLGGRGEEEPARASRPAVASEIASTILAARVRDLRERALEPGSRDPPAAMALVDEDASDPPTRTWRRFLPRTPGGA